jgi:uracil-DNA glycosylase family 4
MNATTARQALFLEEMGIGPLWVRRDKTAGAQAPGAERMPEPAEGSDASSESGMQYAPVLQRRPEQNDAWADTPVISAPHVGQDAPVIPPAHAAEDVAAAIARMNWAELRAEVAACTRCGLCRERSHAVFGAGDEKAKWLFVGEGPGRNEDLQGEPFVGPAGKLLDNMLAAIGVSRHADAYIANIVKCRATDDNGRDRPPTPQEAAACLPYLQRQIELLQPSVIVALGKTAALTLLGADPKTPVTRLRGEVHRYAGRPLIVTYHPAYLLRSPLEKKKAWADLCLAMETCAITDQ